MSVYQETDVDMLFAPYRWLASDQWTTRWPVHVGYCVTRNGAVTVVDAGPLPEFVRIGDKLAFVTALGIALQSKLGLPEKAKLVVSRQAVP